MKSKRTVIFVVIGACIIGVAHFFVSPWAVQRFSKIANTRYFDGLDWIIVNDGSLSKKQCRILVKRLKVDAYKVRLADDELRSNGLIDAGEEIAMKDFILVGTSLRASRDFSSLPRTLVFFYPDAGAILEPMDMLPDFVIIKPNHEANKSEPWLEFCKKNKIQYLLSEDSDSRHLIEDLLKLVKRPRTRQADGAGSGKVDSVP